MRKDIIDQIFGLVEAKNDGDEEAMALWNSVKGDMKTSVDKTRAFIRNVEKLEELADKIVKTVKKAGQERSDGGGFENMPVVAYSEIEGALKKFDKQLNSLYGDFAEGRDAMQLVAKAARISTRRKAGAANKKKSKKAAEMTRGNMLKDLKRYTESLGRQIRDAAERGSRANSVADAMFDRKSPWKSMESFMDDLTPWVNDMVDFKGMIGGVFYGAIKGISKRVLELSGRAKDKPLEKYGSTFRQAMKGIKSGYVDNLDERFPWLFEDEDLKGAANSLKEGFDFNTLFDSIENLDDENKDDRFKFVQLLRGLAAEYDTSDDAKELWGYLMGALSDAVSDDDGDEDDED